MKKNSLFLLPFLICLVSLAFAQEDAKEWKQKMKDMDPMEFKAKMEKLEELESKNQELTSEVDRLKKSLQEAYAEKQKIGRASKQSWW